MSFTSVTDTKMVTQTQTLSPDAAGMARQAKLKDAAQQFEGMMLQELLKPMQRAGASGGGGFDGEDEGTATSEAGFGDGANAGYSSYGVEAMATALAKNGGLGIAKEVLRQIGRQVGDQAGSRVGRQNGNPDEKKLEKSSSTKV